MTSPLKTPPTNSELEISLFGPGIGECAVVHLGCNEWMVVDSCVNPRTRNPAALDYLHLLGVPIDQRLRTIVVTHWHRDHFKGISTILRAASSAKFWCSNALQSKEFLQFVFRSEEDRPRQGTEIEEFAEVFRILKARSPASHPATVGPEWAIADRPVFQRTQTSNIPQAQVDAVSPSSATVTAAITNLRELIPYDSPNRRPVAISANRLAVALWVRFGHASALLGADLEDSGQANMGWNAIISSNSGRYVDADFFKVPHHGSPNGHNPGVWQTMLKADAHCALTPYLVSSLPTDADVRRLRSLTSKVYSTAPPQGNKPGRRASTVEKILAHHQIRSALGTGQVRIRVDATDLSSLRVELFDGALRLTN